MKRFGLLIVCWLALTTPGFGAIAHDADSFSGMVNGDLSWNHTCTGSNLLLVVGVQWNEGGGARAITAITYNGVAMTPIGTSYLWDSNVRRIQLFYLAGPASGAHAIAVTFSGAADLTWAGGTSLTGVDQANPLDASDKAANTSTTPTVTFTTIADNAWIVDTWAGSSSGYTYSPNAPGVLSWDDSVDTYGHGGSYRGPLTPAGAKTTSWTATASIDWGIYGASFKPAAAGGTKRRVIISD